MRSAVFNLCLFLVFTVGYSGVAVAKTPKCGEISKRDIRNVFDSAKDVRFYFDVRDDLVKICALLADFKEWERGQGKAKLSNKPYKKHKKDLIEGVRRKFISMNSSLTIIRVWFKVKPQTTKQKYSRIIKIRSAKKDLKIIQAELQDVRTDLRAFMR